MAFQDINITNPYDFFNQTQHWVENGLSVDGIPYIHRINELSIFQWQQITFDLAICVLLVYVLIKVMRTSRISELLIKKIDIIIKENEIKKFNNIPTFKELG
jgi:hypothetical protein